MLIDMNFLIFRYFFIFFLNFFTFLMNFSGFFLNFLNLKSIYLIENQFYKCPGDVAQSGVFDRACNCDC